VAWTDRDGIRQRRTVSGKTQAEVGRQVAQLRAQLDHGLPPPKAPTVSDYLAVWLEASRQRLRPAITSGTTGY
jgi:hypothetical protein